VLLGGNSERERLAAASISVGASAPVVNLMGATSLPQLVAALARCRLLISPDTGAVHMANALGRPVVGLYAVAPASRTGPYSHTEYCVDVFEEGVRTLLGRDPATVPWSQRVHDPRAMGLISVAAVLEKIQKVTERDDVMARQ
jgi:heptosyltransferase I